MAQSGERMKGVLRKLSRPGLIAAIAILFVVALAAWGYWMGIAAPP